MSKFSRRDFIKYSTFGLGSFMLTACGLNELPTPAAPNASPTSLPVTSSSPLPANEALLFTPSPAAISTQKQKGESKPTKVAKTDGAQKQGGKNAQGAPSSANPDFIATEILGRPTNTSITVNVVPAVAMTLYYKYGPASGTDTFQTAPQAAAAGVPLETMISGLQPNTLYNYRIRYAEKSGPNHTFATQRAPGNSFVFTIDADPHNQDPNFNGELYAITLANALKDHPDFHINLGDTFMTEKRNITSLEGVAGTYTDMRPHFGLVGADAPLFLVNGNHEGELGWFLNGSDQNLAVWCTRTRQKYYPNPAPGAFYSGSTTPEPLTGIRDSYFAWTWGDAQFIVLDPFWYTHTKPQQQPNSNWGWTLGKAQYDWLKQTLESSKAKFKFIFIHNLVGGRDKDARGGIESAGFYEWGGKNQDGSWGFDQQRPGWDLPIHQLMVKNRVNAMFHGHDHVFVKQDLDGIVYQECPQPSISRYDNTQLAQDYGYVNGKVIGSSGHLRVTVTAEKTTVEYIRAYLPKDETSSRRNGQVAYAYTIV